MKTSTAVNTLVVLLTTATALAENRPAILMPADGLPLQPIETSFPGLLGGDDLLKLDTRQATAIDKAPVQPTQAPFITTMWPQTVIDGTTTWVPVVYTQTFADVIDQWPPPLSGEIGYGTLTKEKRDVAPQPTVYLIPVEMVLQTVNVVVPIQPVLPVEVIQTVTVATPSLVNASPTSSVRTSAGSSSPGETLATASLGFMNGSTGASRSFMAGFTAVTAWNRTLLVRLG